MESFTRALFARKVLAPRGCPGRGGPALLLAQLLALASPEQKAALGTLPPGRGGHCVQEARPQDCSTGGRGCGGQWGAAEKGSNSLADVSQRT